MNQPTLTNVTAQRATEIASHLQLEGEAAQLLRDDLTPAAYLDLLVQREQYVPAIQFLAHALPKREAVAWACQCVRNAGLGALDDIARAALDAAEQWVLDPSEPNRRAAQAAAEKAGYDTPAGCAAAAAFFSGGSLAPAHVPEVPPGPTLTAQAAAGSILLAAVLKEPEKALEKQRDFLRRGMELGGGTRQTR